MKSPVLLKQYGRALVLSPPLSDQSEDPPEQLSALQAFAPAPHDLNIDDSQLVPHSSTVCKSIKSGRRYATVQESVEHCCGFCPCASCNWEWCGRPEVRVSACYREADDLQTPHRNTWAAKESPGPGTIDKCEGKGHIVGVSLRENILSETIFPQTGVFCLSF